MTTCTKFANVLYRRQILRETRQDLPFNFFLSSFTFCSIRHLLFDIWIWTLNLDFLHSFFCKYIFFQLCYSLIFLFLSFLCSSWLFNFFIVFSSLCTLYPFLWVFCFVNTILLHLSFWWFLLVSIPLNPPPPPQPFLQSIIPISRVWIRTSHDEHFAGLGGTLCIVTDFR